MVSSTFWKSVLDIIMGFLAGGGGIIDRKTFNL